MGSELAGSRVFERTSELSKAVRVTLNGSRLAAVVCDSSKSVDIGTALGIALVPCSLTIANKRVSWEHDLFSFGHKGADGILDLMLG